jgi:mannose-6-phosphate isomerase-like protein (cupin superfamily)
VDERNREGWRTGRLDQIPPLGPAAEREYWERWGAPADFGRRWHSIRRYFGIEGFGVNANEADAGEQLVAHHAGSEHGGQEEIYYLVRGRARFICDGEEVDLSEGEIIYVPPHVTREAHALETPTLAFMVGGVPGGPYSVG